MASGSSPREPGVAITLPYGEAPVLIGRGDTCAANGYPDAGQHRVRRGRRLRRHPGRDLPGRRPAFPIAPDGARRLRVPAHHGPGDPRGVRPVQWGLGPDLPAPPDGGLRGRPAPRPVPGDAGPVGRCIEVPEERSASWAESLLTFVQRYPGVHL